MSGYNESFGASLNDVRYRAIKAKCMEEGYGIYEVVSKDDLQKVCTFIHGGNAESALKNWFYNHTSKNTGEMAQKFIADDYRSVLIDKYKEEGYEIYEVVSKDNLQKVCDFVCRGNAEEALKGWFYSYTSKKTGEMAQKFTGDGDYSILIDKYKEGNEGEFVVFVIYKGHNEYLPLMIVAAEDYVEAAQIAFEKPAAVLKAEEYWSDLKYDCRELKSAIIRCSVKSDKESEYWFVFKPADQMDYYAYPFLDDKNLLKSAMKFSGVKIKEAFEDCMNIRSDKKVLDIEYLDLRPNDSWFVGSTSIPSLSVVKDALKAMKRREAPMKLEEEFKSFTYNADKEEKTMAYIKPGVTINYNADKGMTMEKKPTKPIIKVILEEEGKDPLIFTGYYANIDYQERRMSGIQTRQVDISISTSPIYSKLQDVNDPDEVPYDVD